MKLFEHSALPVTRQKVVLSGGPTSKAGARVGQVADSQLQPGGNIGEAVELLAAVGGVVVVVAVGQTAVVCPAHPGEQARLVITDNHRVGLEYRQHLLRTGKLRSLRFTQGWKYHSTFLLLLCGVID